VRTHKNFELGRFHFNVGWYPGEDFALFSLSLFRVLYWSVQIFDFQFLKFCLTCEM